MIQFTVREASMILAGLRMMQSLQRECDGFSLNENEIATDSFTIEPLTIGEIDELCERINLDG